MKEDYIPIGTMSLRGPDGEIIPSVTIYASTEELGDVEPDVDAAAKVFADIFKSRVSGFEPKGGENDG